MGFEEMYVHFIQLIMILQINIFTRQSKDQRAQRNGAGIASDAATIVFRLLLAEIRLADGLISEQRIGIIV